MKLTPEVARTVARKLGYISNSQGSDIEYVLSLLVNGTASTIEEAIAIFHKEFEDEDEDDDY